MSETKWCNKCKTFKGVDEFWKGQAYCKDCKRKLRRGDGDEGRLARLEVRASELQRGLDELKREIETLKGSSIAPEYTPERLGPPASPEKPRGSTVQERLDALRGGSDGED